MRVSPETTDWLVGHQIDRAEPHWMWMTPFDKVGAQMGQKGGGYVFQLLPRWHEVSSFHPPYPSAMMFLPYHRSRSEEIKWSWSNTLEAVSRNKAILLINSFSQYFVTPIETNISPNSYLIDLGYDWGTEVFKRPQEVQMCLQVKKKKKKTLG